LLTAALKGANLTLRKEKMPSEERRSFHKGAAAEGPGRKAACGKEGVEWDLIKGGGAGTRSAKPVLTY